jgi:hypothetical protein
MIYFTSQCQRFQAIVLDSIDSGHMVRQNLMVTGAHGRGHSPHDGKEKRVRRERRGTEPGITFKDKPQPPL